GGTNVTFNQRDVDALSDKFNAPDVKSVSPVSNATGVTMVNGSSSYEPSTFSGTVPSYFDTRSYSIATGEMFTDADVKAHKRVIVLGPTVVSSLFNGADPVGQTVRVDGTGFQVIGVTASKGSNRAQHQDATHRAPLP